MDGLEENKTVWPSWTLIYVTVNGLIRIEFDFAPFK